MFSTRGEHIVMLRIRTKTTCCENIGWKHQCVHVYIYILYVYAFPIYFGDYKMLVASSSGVRVFEINFPASALVFAQAFSVLESGVPSETPGFESQSHQKRTTCLISNRSYFLVPADIRSWRTNTYLCLCKKKPIQITITTANYSRWILHRTLV